ncbi:34685_t:CDS:2, partial [Gigaspora margarita]
MFVCENCNQREVKELGTKCTHCQDEIRERQKAAEIKRHKRQGSQFTTPINSKQNSPTQSRRGSQSETTDLIQFSRSSSPENEKKYRRQVDSLLNVGEFTGEQAKDGGSYSMEDSLSSDMFGSISESQLLSQFPTKEDSEKTLEKPQPKKEEIERIEPFKIVDNLGKLSETYQEILKENESPIDPQNKNYQSPSVSPIFQNKRLSLTPAALNFITTEITEEIARSPSENNQEFNYSEEIFERVNNLGEQKLETIIEEDEEPENEENKEDFREVIDVQKNKLVRKKLNVKKFYEKTGKKVLEFGSKAADIALSETTQNIVKVALAPIPGGSVAADLTIGGLRKAREVAQNIQQKRKELKGTSQEENENETISTQEARGIYDTSLLETLTEGQLELGNKLDQLITRRQSINDKLSSTVDITQNQLMENNKTGLTNLQTNINTNFNSLDFSTQFTQLKTDLIADLKPQPQNNTSLFVGLIVSVLFFGSQCHPIHTTVGPVGSENNEERVNIQTDEIQNNSEIKEEEISQVSEAIQNKEHQTLIFSTTENTENPLLTINISTEEKKEYTKLSMKIKRWKEQGKNISDLLYQREQLMVIPSQNVIPQKQKNDVIPNLNVLNVIPKNEVGNVIPRTKSELVANNVKPENVIPEPEPDKKIEPVKLWSDYYSVKKPTCFNCLKAGIKENEY